MNIKKFNDYCLELFKPFGIEKQSSIPLALAIQENLNKSELRGFYLNEELIHVAVIYNGQYVDSDGIQSSFEMQDKLILKTGQKDLFVKPITSDYITELGLFKDKHDFITQSVKKMLRELKIVNKIKNSFAISNWMNNNPLEAI